MSTTPDGDTPLLPAPESPKLLTGRQAKPKDSRWRRHAKAISAGALALFLLIAFAFGWVLHHRRAGQAEQTSDAARKQLPRVNVVVAKRSAPLSGLMLPGSLAAITEASLYARAAGYVTHRYVDIGDSVRKGQVLAEIESPELDQQAAQALAMTAQSRQQLVQVRTVVGDARAKLDLAKITAARYDTLLEQDAATRQDVDQRHQELASAQAAFEAAEANVGAADASIRAAEANQRRLSSLQQYEKLRAPFDGVITARNVDEGALISDSGASLAGSTASPLMPLGSGSGTGSSGSATGSGTSGDASGSSSASSGAAGTPLFRIAQLDRLRVYVSVPQSSAASVVVGSVAMVQVQELAAPLSGRVTRTARALDPSSRTLLTEVQIDNAREALMPGMYAQVRFTGARSNPPLVVPGEALIVRAGGAQVATVVPLDSVASQRVDADDRRCARKIRLKPVAIGRDYGTEVEIAGGLTAGEFVVTDPGDTVQADAAVLPRLQPPKPAGGGGQGGNKPGAGKQTDGKQDGGKGDGKADGKGSGDASDLQRDPARTTCIEQQAQAAAQHEDAASASAPAGESPSEKMPAGVQSPSMAAPTQGSGRKPARRDSH